jgi:hypothetical protein
LLNYSVNTSGVYVPGDLVPLGSASPSGSVDVSPDGTKIAYADGHNSDHLMVLDLTTGEKTQWAEGVYYWDVAWFRGGASLVYATNIPLEIREVTAPMATPQLLYSNGQGEIHVETASSNPNQLVISYNDTTGAARIGLWEAGVGFVNPDLANSDRSWFGNMNCTGTKLVYGGVQNTSGSQAYYVRDLNTGSVTLLSKNSNIMPQYWPTC